jgi:hypothetical protein
MHLYIYFFCLLCPTKFDECTFSVSFSFNRIEVWVKKNKECKKRKVKITKSENVHLFRIISRSLIKQTFIHQSQSFIRLYGCNTLDGCFLVLSPYIDGRGVSIGQWNTFSWWYNHLVSVINYERVID